MGGSVRAAQAVAPPDTARPVSPRRTAASYGLVLVLTVLCALWGVFLVPLRVAGVPVPVAVLFAAAVYPLGVAAARLTASRLGAAGPALVWLGIASLGATPRREGDLLVLPTLTGYAFLLVGVVAAAAPIGLGAPPAHVGSRV